MSNKGIWITGIISLAFVAAAALVRDGFVTASENSLKISENLVLLSRDFRSGAAHIKTAAGEIKSAATEIKDAVHEAAIIGQGMQKTVAELGVPADKLLRSTHNVNYATANAKGATANLRLAVEAGADAASGFGPQGQQLLQGISAILIQFDSWTKGSQMPVDTALLTPSNQ